jgi:MFS family permease
MERRVALTPGQMILLGIGWFGFQVFWAFHAATLPLFLAGITDSRFGISLVLGLSGLSGFLVPAIVGYLSDRTSSRFGRRTPWVVAGMVGVLVCVLALMQLTTFGSVAVAAGLMYVSLRLAETPFLSILPDLVPEEQRSTASGVMNLVGSVGLILCFVAGAVLWERSPQAMFVLVAVGCSVPTIAAVVLLRERPGRRGTSVTLAASFHSLAGERAVVRFLGAQLLWWLGFWMVSSFLVLFATEALAVAAGTSFLVPLSFSLVATVAMLPAGILGDRFGRKAILSLMIGLWAISGLLVGLSQNLAQLLAAVALTGIPFAAVMVIGYAFFLDLIPAGRTAEFVGIGILTGAVAQFVGPLIAGQLIDAIGYRAIFPAAAAFQVAGLVLLHGVPQKRGSGDDSDDPSRPTSHT